MGTGNSPVAGITPRRIGVTFARKLQVARFEPVDMALYVEDYIPYGATLAEAKAKFDELSAFANAAVNDFLGIK